VQPHYSPGVRTASLTRRVNDDITADAFAYDAYTNYSAGIQASARPYVRRFRPRHDVDLQDFGTCRNASARFFPQEEPGCIDAILDGDATWTRRPVKFLRCLSARTRRSTLLCGLTRKRTCATNAHGQDDARSGAGYADRWLHRTLLSPVQPRLGTAGQSHPAGKRADAAAPCWALTPGTHSCAGQPQWPGTCHCESKATSNRTAPLPTAFHRRCRGCLRRTCVCAKLEIPTKQWNGSWIQPPSRISDGRRRSNRTPPPTSEQYPLGLLFAKVISLYNRGPRHRSVGRTTADSAASATWPATSRLACGDRTSPWSCGASRTAQLECLFFQLRKRNVTSIAASTQFGTSNGDIDVTPEGIVETVWDAATTSGPATRERFLERSCADPGLAVDSLGRGSRSLRKQDRRRLGDRARLRDLWSADGTAAPGRRPRYHRQPGRLSPDIAHDSAGAQIAIWSNNWEIWLTSDSADTTPRAAANLTAVVVSLRFNCLTNPSHHLQSAPALDRPSPRPDDARTGRQSPTWARTVHPQQRRHRHQALLHRIPDDS